MTSEKPLVSTPLLSFMSSSSWGGAQACARSASKNLIVGSSSVVFLGPTAIAGSARSAHKFRDQFLVKERLRA